MKLRLITIPNLLTLANLLCGSAAAAVALTQADLQTAFWLVAAAAVFDFLDGFAARLLGSESPVGGELDSLADDISFGFAPAAVLFAAYAGAPAAWGWSAGAQEAGRWLLFVLAAASALRLARFNVDTTQRDDFLGLPVPASALLCVATGALIASERLVLHRETLVAATLVLSWLLVSPVRMFSLKFHGFGWRDNALRYIYLAAALVLLLLFGWQAGAALAVVLYVVVATVRWLVRRPGRGSDK